jgi:hypothetical protein
MKTRDQNFHQAVRRSGGKNFGLYRKVEAGEKSSRTIVVCEICFACPLYVVVDEGEYWKRSYSC